MQPLVHDFGHICGEKLAVEEHLHSSARNARGPKTAEDADLLAQACSLADLNTMAAILKRLNGESTEGHNAALVHASLGGLSKAICGDCQGKTIVFSTACGVRVHHLQSPAPLRTRRTGTNASTDGFWSNWDADQGIAQVQSLLPTMSLPACTQGTVERDEVGLHTGVHHLIDGC